MANKYTYEISINDGQFEHGKMVVEKINQLESAVEIDVELVILSDNAEELRQDLEKLIEKYAI